MSTGERPITLCFVGNPKDYAVQCIYGSKIKGRKLARRYGRADGRRDEL